MTNVKKSIKEAIKFSLIGILNTCVDWGLFWIFLNTLSIDKSISQILATAFAMLNSFFFNKYWTFRQREKTSALELSKFLLVNLAALASNLLCISLFYDVIKIHIYINQLIAFIGIDYVFLGNVAIMLAKIISAPISLAVNFLGNKLWVFRKKSRK